MPTPTERLDVGEHGYKSQGGVQDPSEDIHALRSFFQNTWNAQRSQLPVLGPKIQAPAVNGEASRAIPAIHGNKATQQSPVNGHSGQTPRQSASLPSGWHSMQVMIQHLLRTHSTGSCVLSGGESPQLPAASMELHLVSNYPLKPLKLLVEAHFTGFFRGEHSPGCLERHTMSIARKVGQCMHAGSGNNTSSPAPTAHATGDAASPKSGLIPSAAASLHVSGLWPPPPGLWPPLPVRQPCSSSGKAGRAWQTLECAGKTPLQVLIVYCADSNSSAAEMCKDFTQGSQMGTEESIPLLKEAFGKLLYFWRNLIFGGNKFFILR